MEENVKVDKLSSAEKVTFVCCPKPFTTDFKDIQYNAIKSWTLLKTVDKILICGDEEGVEDFAKHIQTETTTPIEYIKKVKRTVNGTPLVNSIFKIGSTHSQKYVCYINCDIILLSDFDTTFTEYINKFPKQKQCLLVGRRWDWQNPAPVNFDDHEWQTNVKNVAINDGHMHTDSAIDYFIHTNTTFPKIHPFAIGKFFWDNWLVGNAFRRPEVITIDLTETVFAIHQNSPWYVYSQSVSEKSKATDCEEAVKNRSFDSFGRRITNGTKYNSTMQDDQLTFVKKNTTKIYKKQYK
jgi:hypothetical protein